MCRSNADWLEGWLKPGWRTMHAFATADSTGFGFAALLSTRIVFSTAGAKVKGPTTAQTPTRAAYVSSCSTYSWHYVDTCRSSIFWPWAQSEPCCQHATFGLGRDVSRSSPHVAFEVDNKCPSVFECRFKQICVLHSHHEEKKRQKRQTTKHHLVCDHVRKRVSPLWIWLVISGSIV